MCIIIGNEKHTYKQTLRGESRKHKFFTYVSWSLLLRYKQRMGKNKKCQNGKGKIRIPVKEIDKNDILLRFNQSCLHATQIIDNSRPSSINAAFQAPVDVVGISRLFDQERFERLFFIKCAAFYKLERQRLLAENSESGYVEKAHVRIIEAGHRAKLIGFDKTTAQKFVELATDILLNGNIKTILTVGPRHVDQESKGSICLADFILAETVCNTPCNHLFHNQCITTWFEKENTCPLCRTNCPLITY